MDANLEGDVNAYLGPALDEDVDMSHMSIDVDVRAHYQPSLLRIRSVPFSDHAGDNLLTQKS